MSQLTNYRREIALPGLWHDYANLFPMLDAAGQDALRADIQLYGVREPVILFSDRILDGRNRYMAARDLGLDFPVVDFDGTEAEALAYVLSTNLHRRHLTESQRAAVAAKLANMGHGGDRKSDQAANLPDDRAPISQAQAAEMLNVSERSVRTAKTVIEHGAPELVAAVESGAVSVSAAAAVTELPQEEQAAVVAEGPKAVKAKAKAVREKKDAPVQGDAQPEIDPETAKLRREIGKLTTEAMIDEIIGLRADVAERKATIKDLRDEVATLKSEIALYRQDNLGRALGNEKRRADAAEGRMREHQANAARLQRQVNAQKAEIERLKRESENQVIPI